MTTVRYIPFYTLCELNEHAFENGGKSLTPECPILSEGNNVPISLAKQGVQRAGWVRLMIPASIYSTEQVLLDVPLDVYNVLPSVEMASNC